MLFKVQMAFIRLVQFSFAMQNVSCLVSPFGRIRGGTGTSLSYSTRSGTWMHSSHGVDVQGDGCAKDQP